MTHDELIKVLLNVVFENIRNGSWTQQDFEDWYHANVMEAQNEAVYYQNL